MFKPTTLRAYLLRAGAAGIAPEEILDGSGITWADIEGQRPLDLPVIAALFDSLATRTPQGFSLQCGGSVQIRDFGIVGFAMMSMPTLRDAFECLNRYCQLLGHPLINRLTEAGAYWHMEFVPREIMSDAAMRFCAEISIAAVEPVIEELTERPASTVRLDLPFSRPESIEAYAQFRTSSIRFGRKLPTYIGDRSDLDRPIRSRDAEVSDIFLAQCERCLSALMHGTTVREQLENLMLMSPGAIPTLDDMASALAQSRRSLQRELACEGLTYQQLVRDYRTRQAKTMLSGARANTKAIAYALGFADVGSFRRAFHDWTGQSIAAWQLARRAERRVGAAGSREFELEVRIA
ncbi:MAG: AraC family transcriptional regulator ligand-binding domain-containing protein [Sphingomonadales bacterium]|nr:AraC family transcriptional regulator ligand-binding domain-containing protein [Sphingomonadales bacterium]